MLWRVGVNHFCRAALPSLRLLIIVTEQPQQRNTESSIAHELYEVLLCGDKVIQTSKEEVLSKARDSRDYINLALSIGGDLVWNVFFSLSEDLNPEVIFSQLNQLMQYPHRRRHRDLRLKSIIISLRSHVAASGRRRKMFKLSWRW